MIQPGGDDGDYPTVLLVMTIGILMIDSLLIGAG